MQHSALGITSLTRKAQKLLCIIQRTEMSDYSNLNRISDDLSMGVTETTEDTVKTLKSVYQAVRSAKSEVLVLFSSSNAFVRQERAGGVQLLKECTSRQNLKAKILTPKSNHVEGLRSELKLHNIEVKYIQEFSQTKITVVIVDRKFSFVLELKTDDTMDTLEAVGLSTYSTRASTVLSYVSIFESYWVLSQMYEESRNELASTKEYLSKVLKEIDNKEK